MEANEDMLCTNCPPRGIPELTQGDALIAVLLSETERGVRVEDLVDTLDIDPEAAEWLSQKVSSRSMPPINANHSTNVSRITTKV